MKRVTEFIDEESFRIDEVESLIDQAILLFQDLRPIDSCVVDWEYVMELKKRVFAQEQDYLERNPIDYFDLYSSTDESLFDDRLPMDNDTGPIDFTLPDCP